MVDRIIGAAETVMQWGCIAIAAMFLLDAEPEHAAAYVALALAGRALHIADQQRKG